jgi:hypothetical protein
MVLLQVSYDTYCAFFVGLAIGRGDGVLDAFRDWMADRQPHHKNYAFESMVLAEMGLRQLGDTQPRGELSTREDKAAREALLALLRQFLAEADPCG